MTMFMIGFLFACHQEDEEILDTVAEENTKDVTDTTVSTTAIINNWIYDVMRSVYYWNEDVVAPGSSETDPESYFKSLINSDDRFSYITDDYEALAEEFSGVYTSMGYSPTFGRFSGSNEVFIAVEYVYPGSPAEEAGLKRGDIILKIDGQTLDTDNYFDLYNQSQYSVTLGGYDAETTAISNTGQTLSLASRVISTDPVLYKEVKTVEGIKIGYLVYAEFISGDSDEWLNSLGAAIDEFSQAGVTELIVDLRYNPGGEVSTAQYLASALAPATAVNSQEVLIKYQYNDQLESSLIANQSSDALVTTFESNSHHLNLNRIYFLTGSGTASASELLINGLEPYMEVTTVGETTVGKCYGSWVIPDTEEPARHTWAIMPIVLKYANADGLTDFVDGLTPDYVVEDDLLNAKPFGDEGDPVLATALNLITGGPNVRIKQDGVRKPYQTLENPIDTRKSNLIIKPSLPNGNLPVNTMLESE